MKNTHDSIQDAAGCLGAMPSRAGMTAIGSRMALEQNAAGGKSVFFDKETSSNLREHRLILGSTRTGKSLLQPTDELLTQTTRLGVLGGSLLAKQNKGSGVRQPISPKRKIKARKAAKAAAKSRRRNRQ